MIQKNIVALGLNENPEWMKSARCRETDPEIFYPERGSGATVATQAYRICAGCEVRVQCLQYAVDNKEVFGIWGGLNEKARRKLKRKKAA